jgi:hypothetical protein
MFVRCVSNSRSDLSRADPNYLSENKAASGFDTITPGDTYFVSGVLLLNFGAKYLIYNEKFEDFPEFLSANFFRPVDGTVSKSWFVGEVKTLHGISTIAGYKELRTQRHFDGILNRDPDEVDLFVKRSRESIKAYGAEL